MKFIYCLLLAFFNTIILHSQNCNTLDNKSFFKSIKFGNQIPDELFLCSKIQKNTLFRVEYDSLNQHCKKKYSDLFKFLTVPYSFLQISRTQKGKISSVGLYSFFDDNRGKTYEPPANFINTYNKLISLHGKPTRIEEPTATDSLFIKELGMSKLVAWECENIFLTLRVRYGAASKVLNILEIQIMDRSFDIPETVENY